MGRVSYEGKIKHPFTAHPKIDPQTGERSFCVHQLLGLSCTAVQQMQRYIHPGIPCVHLTFVASATWSVHSNVGKPLLFSSAWYKQTLVLIYDVQFFICSICE